MFDKDKLEAYGAVAFYAVMGGVAARLGFRTLMGRVNEASEEKRIKVLNDQDRQIQDEHFRNTTGYGLGQVDRMKNRAQNMLEQIDEGKIIKNDEFGRWGRDWVIENLNDAKARENPVEALGAYSQALKALKVIDRLREISPPLEMGRLPYDKIKDIYG